MSIFLPNSVLGYAVPYSEPTPISTPFVFTYDTIQQAPVKRPARENHGPNWQDVLRRNCKAILELSEGWDGYHGKRISNTTISHANLILRDALAGVSHAVAPYIIPAADGSLQIEWNNQEHELEFYLSEGLSYSTWLRNRETGREIEGEGDEALSLLFRWAPGLAAPTGNARDEASSQEEAPIGIAA